ncbi:DUF4179 domain-containing protein [Paraclostridium tenue]|uniref:DUF4179 domain-containing protein n=1 Tax=Paraclostridium tenue TaxID=1737 RepID=A0ABN1M9K5_9FIRM
MSKFDEIKIPESIDELTKKAMKKGKDYKKKRKYKKIMIASFTGLIIGTGAIRVSLINPAIAESIPMIQEIVDYFSHNEKSLYKSDKDDLENLGKDLNLTVNDKGIEFTIDSVSVDDNYITVFYTVKSDKNIKEINKYYKDPYFASPTICTAYIGGKNIIPDGFIEKEATYISNNEIRGIQKIDISYINIKNDTEVEFRIDEIFETEGNWKISTKIDKSKAISKTHNYKVNKNFKFKETLDYEGKKVNVKHKVNIEKVIISPLANKILINEKINKSFEYWEPIMGNRFALFDENGKSLDVLEKGETGVDPRTGIATNSYEFLKADKDTKTLTLVPISYDENTKDKMLKPQGIDNLPIVFETSKYGKVVIEDIQITDKEIRYTYYKDGVVRGYPHLYFFDENDKEIQFDIHLKESLDRHTGRYTTIFDIGNSKKNTSKIKDIKKVSTYTDNSMNLLYDQQMKFDLVK